MTTVFPNNIMTNGVVQEQFNSCGELSATTSPDSTTPPLPPPTNDHHSLDDKSAVKLEATSEQELDITIDPLDDKSAVKLEATSEQELEINSLDDKSAVKSDATSEQELDITINNVVCSFSLGCHLNLRTIALNAHNVEYRRESGMVTMKLRKPTVTASVWSSGKITCTGATSEDEASTGARRIARIIQKLGFDAKIRKWRIVNVLGSCSMPFDIKINAFSQHHREAEYEPELHPGVTYKVKDLKATMKIFSTGSITVTAPSVPNVQSAIEHIFPLVNAFRKEKEPNREDAFRKRALTAQMINQDKVKRKRLNYNSCSSNDDEDKEVQSITTR